MAWGLGLGGMAVELALLASAGSDGGVGGIRFARLGLASHCLSKSGLNQISL